MVIRPAGGQISRISSLESLNRSMDCFSDSMKSLRRRCQGRGTYFVAISRSAGVCALNSPRIRSLSPSPKAGLVVKKRTPSFR